MFFPFGRLIPFDDALFGVLGHRTGIRCVFARVRDVRVHTSTVERIVSLFAVRVFPQVRFSHGIRLLR